MASYINGNAVCVLQVDHAKVHSPLTRTKTNPYEYQFNASLPQKPVIPMQQIVTGIACPGY